jgi:hypothetical protein
MLKDARATLLLLVMLWQAVAWLTPFGVAQKAEEIAHVLVHTQEVDHHHHDDRSLHLEDADGEPPHEHAGNGAQPAALPPAIVASLPEFPEPPRYPAATADRPSAFLEGPLRPPRLRA